MRAFDANGAVKQASRITGPIGQATADESVAVVMASDQPKTVREKADFDALLQQLIQVNEKLAILIEKRK